MEIRLPHEWVVFILGERLAPYLIEIQMAIGFIGGILILLFGKKTKPRKRIKPIVNNIPIYVDQDNEGRYVYRGEDKNKPKQESPVQEMYFGQYDRYSNLTDEEMKLAMQIRIERNGPTYEEWKAAREAENKVTNGEC